MCVDCQSELEEFAFSRKQHTGANYGYRRNRRIDWAEDPDSYDIDDDLVASGIDIYDDYDDDSDDNNLWISMPPGSRPQEDQKPDS